MHHILAIGIWENSINATVLFVTQVTLVGVSFTVLETLRSRVVLDNKVVPVNDPDSAVRTNFRHDRRGPFVVAGQQIRGTGRLVGRAVATQQEGSDQMTGRFAYEGSFVPPLHRERTSRIQSMTGCGGVATELIDLTDVLRDRTELPRICNGANIRRGPTTDLFVITIRNRHVGARVVIRGGPEYEPIFTEPQSPCVVVCRPDEFNVVDFRGIRVRQFETPEALPERITCLAVEFRRAVVVALHRPDPVVQTIAKIADAAMSITGTEPRHQHSLLIGLVITVGIFQVNRFGRVVNHRTAAINHDGGWNRKTFGEDRKLVGDMVTICIFTDANSVAVLAEFVGIVERFADPQTASFIPVHGDGLGEEVAFVRVSSQDHAFRHRIMLHRFFDAQRKLHRRLGCSLNTPLTTGRIVRNLRTDFDILKRLHILRQFRHLRRREGLRVLKRRNDRDVFAARPANTAFDEIWKAGIRPRA